MNALIGARARFHIVSRPQHGQRSRDHFVPWLGNFSLEIQAPNFKRPLRRRLLVWWCADPEVEAAEKSEKH